VSFSLHHKAWQKQCKSDFSLTFRNWIIRRFLASAECFRLPCHKWTVLRINVKTWNWIQRFSKGVQHHAVKILTGYKITLTSPNQMTTFWSYRLVSCHPRRLRRNRGKFPAVLMYHTRLLYTETANVTCSGYFPYLPYQGGSELLDHHVEEELQCVSGRVKIGEEIFPKRFRYN
jgi:hypothetical protein